MLKRMRFTALALLDFLMPVVAAHATLSSDLPGHGGRSCSVSAGGALAFGTYTGSVVDASTTLSVTCTNTTARTVGLSNGSNFSIGRRMKYATSDYLSYELYKDVGHSSPSVEKSASLRPNFFQAIGFH